MDAKELGNQAAHPWIRHGSERGVEWKESEPGMTLRQHFAGLALQGLLSNPGGPVQASPMRGTHYCNTDEGVVAHWAVSQADALLAELAKET